MNNVIFFCGFEYIEKITTGYISRQWLEFLLAVREKSGNFFCQPHGNPGRVSWNFLENTEKYMIFFLQIHV